MFFPGLSEEKLKKIEEMKVKYVTMDDAIEEIRNFGLGE